MQMTQLNTRIPMELKAQGDEVLARFGKTASDVIRSVWQYMADHQRIPGLVDEADAAPEDQFKEKALEIEKGANLVSSLYATLDLNMDNCATTLRQQSATSTQYDDMRESMYEELLDEYEALDA